jgi:hypothetical protein
MWTARRGPISNMQGETIAVASGENMLCVSEVIALWRGDAAFRDFFIAMLAATSYPAFFWEMPPLSDETLKAPFECAVIRSDALARMLADGSDFAEHLDGAEPVAVFPNLASDALLIAPRKMSDTECYTHIASFVRKAPREQQHALFRTLAVEMEKRLASSRERFWVSTSGLGVPWIHVRLDKRPKYYQYDRYAC